MVKYGWCGVDTVVPKGRHALLCYGNTLHIQCTGTKGLAIEVNHLHKNGGSTAYKGRDVSLSLDVDWRSRP